jgi:magnesium-protoporphyrin O-methyltransferase
MPSCCAGDSLDIFGERGARRELRRYLRDGLGGDDAKLIAAWAEEGGLAGATVVEVGGGIGQIQGELVRRGAAAGTVVEVVGAYAGPAAELADAVGIAGRSTFLLADVLQDASGVAPADIVVLRRVVCCSPEGPELLGRAAAKTRGTLLASYPRDRFLVRAVVRLQNAGFRLVRKRFRVFVHVPGTLEQAAGAHGLERTRVARGWVWETAQFEPVREALGPALEARIPQG